MSQIEWHDAYLLGYGPIDEDHKLLISIMSDLERAIEAGDVARCETLTETLMTATQLHFANEEELLREQHYPGLANHAAYHHQMLVEARAVKETCSAVNRPERIRVCFDMMQSLIINDLFEGDLKFKSFLQERGLIRRDA